MATRPSNAWKQPTKSIMMAANKMNPTAQLLVSSPPRAADDEYASSVICRSLLAARGACRPSGRSVCPKASSDRAGVGVITRSGASWSARSKRPVHLWARHHTKVAPLSVRPGSFGSRGRRERLASEMVAVGGVQPGGPPYQRERNEADLLRALDRLAAGGDAELVVHRERVLLHRVVREVQPLADLPEGEVGGQQREHAQLRPGERRCSDALFADRVELGPQLVGLLGEDAQVGPQVEDVPGLPQGFLGAGGVVERQIGAPKLQQRLDGEVRRCVAEQRAQARGPGEL